MCAGACAGIGKALVRVPARRSRGRPASSFATNSANHFFQRSQSRRIHEASATQVRDATADRACGAIIVGCDQNLEEARQILFAESLRLFR